MKNTLIFICILLMSSACLKTSEPEKPAILYLTGTLTDKYTAAPIDSAVITIVYYPGSSLYSYPETTFYSGVNGNFNFHFAPRENTFYNIEFGKQGYSAQFRSIKREVEYQNFIIVLD